MELIRVSRTLALCAVLSASLMTTAPSASAASELGPDDHCSYGAALSIVNAFFPIFWRTAFEGFDDEGNLQFAPNDIVLRCQFRGFFEPAEGICFCEHDVFVGGTVFFGPAENADVIGRLDIDMSVPELADASVATYQTPIKRGHHAVRGFSAWKQWSAVLEQLAPGTYTLHSDYYFDGAPDGTDDISFTVLPHDVAHAHGRPTSGLAGSVVCPAAE